MDGKYNFARLIDQDSELKAKDALKYLFINGNFLLVTLCSVKAQTKHVTS